MHTASKNIEKPEMKSTATQRRYIGVLRMLITFVMLFSSFVAMSQNNPFKIDDRLYPIYMRAFKARTTTDCFAIADTLKEKSILYGDKKAECLAYTIYMLHYSEHRDGKNLEKAVANLKRVSRRNGYLQYYYYGPTIYITYLLNSGKSMLAMQENAKLEADAFADNSHYGILTCLRNMAKIQTSRGNHYMANKYYEEALDYMLKYVTDQDPTSIYKELAEYKRLIKQFDEALSYINKGLSIAKTAVTKSRALQEKCLILLDMGDRDGYEKCYNEWTSYEKNLRYDGSETNTKMQIYRYLYEGDIEKALAVAEKTQRPDNINYMKSVIYEAAGDYKSAYYEYVKSRYIRDSITAMVQASDIAEMNSQISNQLLQTKLKIKEDEAMQLKLKHMQQQTEMERERAENEHLKIENQDLELENLKREKLLLDTENERQQAVLEQQDIEKKYHDKVVAIVGVALFVILAGLFIALVRHRMMIIELGKKNRELEIARNQANSANEMKTRFIHNMSHEIRTPLNSIVGFSDILTTPGMQYSEEEAAEFGKLIRSNSELLTSLVNDLLGLAELESGKYTLDRSHVQCNALCHEALSTVAFNRSDEVELRYTTDVDDEYTLFTDARRVKQVLINYLTNAEKHTLQGSIELRCSVKENPGMVTFSVADTGTGIPAEYVDRLFQRFDKMNNFDKGFGLGLSICRAIAERLEGEAKLDTSYTEGARFVFVHPIVSEEKETKARELHI